MKTAFCTISTNDHLFKVDALFDSLKKVGCSAEMICLATQSGTDNIQNGVLLRPGSIELGENEHVLRRKHNSTSDELRWSLKPVFISALLNQFDKVVYLDNDIYFFDSPTFIWDELENSDVLLTPHNYPRNPKNNQNWLEANFKVGLFNAGFVGVNKNAKSIMDWWADCCVYRCEKSWFRGLFDDQKYLDLVPIIHSNTKILEHKGCNVAGWNIDVCQRTISSNGDITINDTWPIVFVHFNGFSVRAIINGEDSSLKPHLHLYVLGLQKFNPKLLPDNLWKENTTWDRVKLSAWKFLNALNKI
ncbi:MAG: hypothetical protein K9G41_09870 [Flavobacteriales bacterium]|nr:hypothetical protein [Flavobacteriales bacterium]